MPWVRARFKGSLVEVECDEAGKPVLVDGRVPMRYRANDTRVYHAALRNLTLLDGAGATAGDGRKARSRGAGARAGGADPEPPAALPEAKLLSAERLAKPANEAVVAYTDGACSGNPGPCGLGVVLIDGNAVHELSHFLGQGTNNVAELTAIREAARVLAGCTRPVQIHTDSQYAIGVLVKGWRAKANRALVAQVKEALSQLPRVELIYVPGHSGVPLNERADELAVAATTAQASAGWS